ncbi:matrix metalloproteinase-2-like [Stegodyphus dumicola]|uniref:matrix metalloproteinase-2-like n=1 Tax=Stegodyphus dumicola TaxID=202533 RepID=UPI0015AF0B11|nr:matrix metalloproteinase-2-like [Stegodyphus dumicola]
MISVSGLHRIPRIVTRIWTITVAATLLCSHLSSADTEAKTEPPDRERWESVEKYLDQYGYLSSSPQGVAYLRTEDKWKEAVRSMQRFGGLPPTGNVDERTLALLRRPRCGMPDLSPGERVRRYAIQGQQWNKKDLTWSINFYPPSLEKHLVRSEVTKAFKVWSDVSQLNFREVSSNSHVAADIIVSFEHGQHGDGYAFDGKGVVLAHAFFPGEGIGGDAHFDADEPWVDGQPPPGIDGVRLFAVAAHEFGHSLGLSHSSVDGALMNPFYQTIQENFQLPHDDTIGIQMLYGARNPTRWVPLSPYIPPSTRAPVTTPRRPSKPGPDVPKRPATHPPPHSPPHHHPKKPRTCNTTFDAISVIRRELFIFKGKYFWRLNSQGLMKNYPVEIRRFWYDSDLETVDAVYERPIDTKIVFFSGQQYWLFNGNSKAPGYPRPLTDLGLPPDLKRIDAAMVWGYNGKTYLFAGTEYWRYDEAEGRVELDYPRDMSMWRGVPYHIDAAFQHTDGHTYFFKGRKFWQFNDNLMSVKKIKLSNINQYWFGCPSRNEQAPDEDDDEEELDVDLTSKSNVVCVLSNSFLFMSFAVTFLFYRTRLILTL